LGTYLLQERKKDSPKFAEYLDILPKSLRDFPIFFTDEEKALLTGSPFLN
jgi:histone-lysine N-methyltransferase SETD3